MGFFKVRRALNVGGGSVQLGADVNIYRTSANTLKTDDALTVAGLMTGAAGIAGPTAGAGSVNFGGATAAILPYHTVSPNVNNNGQLGFLQKGNRSYLLYQAGGTPCYITLPQVSEGTALFTIGGTP